MQESQYRWTLDNRWKYRPRALFGGPADGQVLREAAHAVRMQRQVLQALESLLPEEQFRWVQIRGVTDDTARLQVSDAVVGEQLRMQSRKLQKDLASRVAGLRRVTIQVAETFGERE